VNLGGCGSKGRGPLGQGSRLFHALGAASGVGNMTTQVQATTRDHNNMATGGVATPCGRGFGKLGGGPPSLLAAPQG